MLDYAGSDTVKSYCCKTTLYKSTKIMSTVLSFYTVVHVHKGKQILSANSSYEAVKKAALFWKLKSTAGIDAYRNDTEIILS